MVKVIIIICSFVFSLSIDAITQVKGDTSKVVTYYKNGTLKSEGTKIKKFRHGSWYYYDEEGYLIKMVKYKNGRMVKEFSNERHPKAITR